MYLNIAGCLCYAELFFYWADALTTPEQIEWAVEQAATRVEANWEKSVSKGIICNLPVWSAFFFSTRVRDYMSKILGIWVAIAIFVALGHQHSIANFFLVPVGMMYGDTGFGVGRFVWKFVIPVTIGNLVGATVFEAVPMWVVYGRHEPRGGLYEGIQSKA